MTNVVTSVLLPSAKVCVKVTNEEDMLKPGALICVADVRLLGGESGDAVAEVLGVDIGASPVDVGVCVWVLRMVTTEFDVKTVGWFGALSVVVIERELMTED